MAATCGILGARHEGVGSARVPLTHPLDSTEKGAAAMVRAPSKIPCTSPGCDRPAEKRGMCGAHYQRLRKTGDAGLDRAFRRLKDPDNFWRQVTKSEGCWQWGGAITNQGYGVASVPGHGRGNGASRSAHIVAYLLTYGHEPPPGTQLDHICHPDDGSCTAKERCLHRSCVNPEHLRVATRRENVLRSTALPSLNKAKTHCPQGHPYAAPTLYVDAHGARRCRPCTRAAESRGTER